MAQSKSIHSGNLRLRSFRLICSEKNIPLVESLLEMEGFLFEKEPFLHGARKLTQEPFPLGSSVAAFFGRIYIQDRSSMLPPMALNAAKDSLVLDMCASPGSKTSQLAMAVGRKGMVLGNEVSPSRLATLRRNLQQMGLSQAISTCYDASSIPLHDGFFPFILLDPPCSGWGTVDKNPKVMDIWKGNKTLPLIALQRKLLTEAARLLAPGGHMVYSTCTTNIAENEEQVLFAKRELGLVQEILPDPQSFTVEDPLLDCAGTWRIAHQKDESQGFFIARFHKPENQSPENANMGNQHPENQNIKNFSKSEKLATSNNSTNAENSEKTSYFAKQSKIKTVKVQEKAYLLSHQDMENTGIDPQAVQGGQIFVFGDNIHFVPEKSNLLGTSVRWQGMYMGKMSKSGELQISPRVRLEGSLPRIELEGKEGLNQIKKLLSGQSLNYEHAGNVGNAPSIGNASKNAILVWNGLVLGRVRLKNKRYLWSER